MVYRFCISSHQLEGHSSGIMVHSRRDCGLVRCACSPCNHFNLVTDTVASAFRVKAFCRSNYAQASSLPFTLTVRSAALPPTSLAVQSEYDSATDLLDAVLHQFSAIGERPALKLSAFFIRPSSPFFRQRPCVCICVSISFIFPCYVMARAV
jgi:hypothetical protein